MKKLFLALLILLIVACARTYATKTSFAQQERQRWQAQADRGDPEAQFRLGNAYCCGSNGFFDTKKAIQWWCRAARQGHEKSKKALIQHDKGGRCKLK